MNRSVIVAGARTPIGKVGGALASHPAASLGTVAIGGALQRAELDPLEVDHVVFGHVIQAGAGPQIARKAAHDAGVPMTVPAMTVNKLCLSGLNAIIQADQLIQSGLAEVVVAGGAESMSNAPYLLDRAREGYRMGDGVLADALMRDGLVCSFDNRSMGESTDTYAADVPGIDRDRQDACAAASHKRAAAARDERSVRTRDRSSDRREPSGEHHGVPRRRDPRRPRRRRARTSPTRVPRRTARSRRGTRARSRTAPPRSW